MSLRVAISITLSAALLLLIAVFALRVVEHYSIPRIELGRVKLTQLDRASRDALQTLQHDVLVTFYVSGREHMPSHMRRIERDVVDVLAAMADASDGRFAFQIIDPEAQPQHVRHAAHQRIAPFRVRSVARDSYTERTVWSSLHIAYGPHEASIINGISPEHLQHLQSLTLGQLHQKDEPRQPVFGVAGGGAYSEFSAHLSQRGRVVNVELSGDEAVPQEIDVLFWFDPTVTDRRVLRHVQAFLDTGRSVVIAGSRHTLRGEQPLELHPTAYDPALVLAPFGLKPIDGLVLDEHSQTVQGDIAPLPARFLVRCIPPNQDFRELRDMPNGHLLFAAPTPLALDSAVLSQQGLTATVLATTSQRSRLASAIYGEVDLNASHFHKGEPATKLPLMVWLRPQEPWRGSIVVSASSSPFRDGAFTASGFAHQRLADVLVQTLAADDRLVIHRADLRRAQPLPEMSSTSRLAWRIICIVALPLLLAVYAVRMGRWQSRFDSLRVRRPAVVGILAIAASLLAVPMLAALGVNVRLDLTADRLNELSQGTRKIAAVAVDEQAVNVTLYISRHSHLPPELRPMTRRLRAMVSEFQRAGAAMSVETIHPEELDAAEQSRLEDQGVQPVQVTTHDEERTIVRTIYSTVRLAGAGRSELLHFPDAASFEHLEFRLAFALWRLQSGRQPHIAFVGDFPRLSAAEAYQDFQQRNLMAPTGSDVYSLARDALLQTDFRVTLVDPQSPTMPDDVDLIIWMQPRRTILPALQQVVDHLHRGVPVMIAAQHFNMQARQYRGAEFDVVYWPQPQVVDLDLHYLPELGVTLVREVLFDRLSGRMPLQTQVNKADGERDYEMQVSALPFLVRAASSNFADHPIMRHLGDQLLPFPAYWKVDEDQLARYGIEATTLMATSPQSWSFNWEGGWIPEDQLTGEAASSPPSSVPLMLLLEGAFPRPAEPLTGRRADRATTVTMAEDKGEPTKLLLLGCSELFKNQRMGDPAYRADHLLINAASVLALPEHLAQIASHRTVARGFGYVQSDERMAWRTVVLAAGPMFLLAFSALWFVSRTRRYKPAGSS